MTGKRLKVLVLADSRSFHTARYVDQLRRQGCDVLLASLEVGDMEHYLLARRGPFHKLHYPLAAGEVQRLVDRFQPDVLNPHFASGYGFMAALVARGQSLPILLHVWGSDILIVPSKSFLHRRKTLLALEAASAVVGDSDYLLSEAGKIGRVNRCKTITWGIERDFLGSGRTDFALGLPLRIIVPRPHEAVYNNMFIVHALATLLRDGKITIDFPSWGSLRQSFEAEAAEFVGQAVRFYNKLPRNEYVSFAAEHDIYLSAALSDSSPASLLEAMGLGLLPVAGDIKGVGEWLTDSTGLLFDLDNERSLYRTVSALVGSDNDYAEMRRSNRARIEARAIFEDNIAETIDLMREITGK